MPKRVGKGQGEKNDKRLMKMKTNILNNFYAIVEKNL